MSEPNWTRYPMADGEPPVCPHCGQEPALEDFQAGRCAVHTDKPLDIFEGGLKRRANDLHGDEMRRPR